MININITKSKISYTK